MAALRYHGCIAIPWLHCDTMAALRYHGCIAFTSILLCVGFQVERWGDAVKRNSMMSHIPPLNTNTEPDCYRVVAALREQSRALRRPLFSEEGEFSVTWILPPGGDLAGMRAQFANGRLRVVLSRP
jgi:hypothetical protein